MKNNIYSRVFLLLFLGVFTSFITGYLLSLNPTIVYNIFQSGIFIVIIIFEFLIALLFGFLLNKMSELLTYICYFLYSIMTGFTLSLIFLAYSLKSILLIFLISSLIFLAVAIYGYFSKKDLSKWGIYLFIGLVGIIISSIINIFLSNTVLDLVVSLFGILIFTLYVAYDVNKVIPYAYNLYGPIKGGIYGAFQVYLDFINIFMDLIRIFGDNSDN